LTYDVIISLLMLTSRGIFRISDVITKPNHKREERRERRANMAEDMEAVRKAQRRKEIEEKRLKLQEMRKKKDDQVGMELSQSPLPRMCQRLGCCLTPLFNRSRSLWWGRLRRR
jgi:hypothetical protein